MKTLVLLICLLSGALALLQGQDTPLPTRKGEPPLPPEKAPAAPPQLIPDDILPAPEVSPAPTVPEIPTIPQLDESLAQKPLNPEAENRRLHIEYRKLRNRAQNDPRVKASLALAEAARTDLEKRKLLARHIEIFFGKMTALGPPEMQPYLLARKQEQLAALPQPRVRPESVPTEANDRARISTATPSPTPRNSPSSVLLPSTPLPDPHP
ncbi:hypothetical protein BH20VER1_BH20VER1_30410 [soil metagenome]|jgi:hypothetical protein